MYLELKNFRAIAFPAVRIHEPGATGVGGFTGRCLRASGLIVLMGLIGLAALLLGGAGAGAQTSVTLASNFGQSDTQHGFGFGHNYGQAFTTGTNAGGYKMTHFDLDIEIATPSGVQPTYRVELWSLNVTTSRPSTKLVQLTNPPLLTTGVMTWTVPNQGYDLKPGTPYAALWFVSPPNGSIGVKVHSTASYAEDSGSWFIYSRALRKPKVGGSWANHGSQVMQIRVRGYNKAVVDAGAPPPDPPNLARSAIQAHEQGVTGPQAPVSPVGGVSTAALHSQLESRVPTGMHPIPVQMSEISSNKPRDASGSLDLRAIADSVSEELRRHSRGFYLTVMVERVSGQRHLFNSGLAMDAERQAYELARGAALLKVHIWHVYYHSGRGVNTVELLGEVFVGRAGDRLVEPVEICLPAPKRKLERAQIAVRGRLDRHWTILDSYLTFDGQICAETVRVAWFTIVMEPESEHTAA